jgi:hypothetical protein
MISPRRATKLVSAQAPRQLIENGIDHAGFVAFDKGRSDVGVFGHHDAGWNVAAVDELIGAGAQSRAQHRLDALERPTF